MIMIKAKAANFIYVLFMIVLFQCYWESRDSSLAFITKSLCQIARLIQWLAVDFSRQDREVAADGLDVVSRGNAGAVIHSL